MRSDYVSVGDAKSEEAGYLAVLVLYLVFSEKKSITLVLVRNFTWCLAWAGMRYSSPFLIVFVLSLMVSFIFPSISMPHWG